MLDGERYERNPDFVFRQVVDELVLIPVHQNVTDMDCIYTMNPVGAFIWQRLEHGATLGDLQASVVEEFATDAETVAADLHNFLSELEAAGAVRRA